MTENTDSKTEQFPYAISKDGFPIKVFYAQTPEEAGQIMLAIANTCIPMDTDNNYHLFIDTESSVILESYNHNSVMYCPRLVHRFEISQLS